MIMKLGSLYRDSSTEKFGFMITYYRLPNRQHEFGIRAHFANSDDQLVIQQYRQTNRQIIVKIGRNN